MKKKISSKIAKNPQEQCRINMPEGLEKEFNISLCETLEVCPECDRAKVSMLYLTQPVRKHHFL